jgi:hypothetical protein
VQNGIARPGVEKDDRNIHDPVGSTEPMMGKPFHQAVFPIAWRLDPGAR